MNNELTAALLTIEKCRELSGCPAGVDLQDWVKQLAEENLAQKNRTQQLIDIINNADNAYCMCGDAMKNHTYGGCGHPTGMFDYHYGKWLEHGNETPANDRIVAGIKADAIDEAAVELDRVDTVASTRVIGFKLREFSQQLREGAK